MNIHIGKIILKKLKESGMSKSEFARRINKSPQNVQDIFLRESIDTKLLFSISSVLDFNFFALYFNDPAATDSQDLLILKEKIVRQHLEIEILKKVNNLLSKSIEDKEEIIALIYKSNTKKK